MSDLDTLARAGQMLGTELRLRSCGSGVLLVPADWAAYRHEAFWIYARRHLPLASDAIQAALVLVHLHGQWNALHGRTPSPRGKAARWLRSALAQSGCASYPDLRRKAQQEGITWDTVRKASQRIGLRKFKRDFRGPWYWSLGDETGGSLGQFSQNS